MRRAWLWVPALLVLFACEAAVPRAPSLSGISPAAAKSGQSVRAKLTGARLVARVKADLDDPDKTTVTLPQVTFLQDGVREAADVEELESDSALWLKTPASLAPGAWSVELKDPWGRTAVLKDAFRVITCASADECDDGIACTEDVCADGHCENALAAGQCLIDGACVADGALHPDNVCLRCDAALDPSDWSAMSNGTACGDGNGCTVGDQCVSGVCQPGPEKTCPSGTVCGEGTCDPDGGACVYAQVSDGGCDDGYACTVGDFCDNGVCRGGPSSCGNTAPLGCVSVAPWAAVPGAPVTFDATCSRDVESAPWELAFRFDFDGDGTWDTAFSAAPTAAFTFAQSGTFAAQVEVQDPEGLSGTAVVHVTVRPPEEDVVVTTGLDEADPNATPLAPGGTGLSLREAILYANATPTVRRIRFTPGLSVGASGLPALTAADVTVAGERDVLLDFSAQTSTGACLALDGLNARAVGLNIVGCPGEALNLGGDQGRVFDVQVADGGTGIRVDGNNAVIGPNVVIRDQAGSAVEIRGLDAVVDGLRASDSGRGVRVQAQQSKIVIQRSVLWDISKSALDVGSGANSDVFACTVHGSGESGLVSQGTATGVTVRSSLFTGNGGYGIGGQQGRYLDTSSNGFFDNAQGARAWAPDAGEWLLDPSYLSPQLGDFRLAPGSPAIDAGVDLGLDLNGPAPGLYNGGAPDLGALESPF